MRQLSMRDLLGRQVHDVDGAAVGRIEELHAVDRGDYLEITHFALGVAGLLERIMALPIVGHSAGALGLPSPEPKVVPWDWLDLRDPQHPRLTRRKRDLPSDPAADSA